MSNLTTVSIVSIVQIIMAPNYIFISERLFGGNVGESDVA